MPYSKYEDMNPSLKGIKPKITLAQGNLIASWADAIGDGGWGIAISKFKKSYTVRGGKWVKRADLKKENKPMEKTLHDTIDKEPVGVVHPVKQDDYATPVAVFNALSFKQLDDQKAASDISEEANELTRQFISIVQNNM